MTRVFKSSSLSYISSLVGVPANQQLLALYYIFLARVFMTRAFKSLLLGYIKPAQSAHQNSSVYLVLLYP